MSFLCVLVRRGECTEEIILGSASTIAEAAPWARVLTRYIPS
jgi:hypothetical protein